MGELPTQMVDRSGLTDVGTDAPLDYAKPEMWVCRPDMEPNQCRQNLDATLIKDDGSYEVVPHTRAERPEFDCFYVYPTVLLSGAPQMVDFTEAGVQLVNDPLLTQGARFNELCEVYAPMYRQIGLSGGAPVEGSDSALGLADVRDAFAYYLEHFNNGRKFVLMGHSQGTAMLTGLIQMDLDPSDKADVRERMISALLIGGFVVVPEGEKVGGSFRNIPTCSEPGETGCFISYNLFANDNPPGETARFGVTDMPGMQVACVDPRVIAGNSGPFAASYFRKAINNPTFAPNTPLPDDLETPFGLYRDVFEGGCVVREGKSYLEISLDTEASDPRTPPWRQTAVEGIGFGLHLVDWHIPMGDLLEAVKQQADAALR